MGNDYKGIIILIILWYNCVAIVFASAIELFAEICTLCEDKETLWCHNAI